MAYWIPLYLYKNTQPGVSIDIDPLKLEYFYLVKKILNTTFLRLESPLFLMQADDPNFSKRSINSFYFNWPFPSLVRLLLRDAFLQTPPGVNARALAKFSGVPFNNQRFYEEAMFALSGFDSQSITIDSLVGQRLVKEYFSSLDLSLYLLQNFYRFGVLEDMYVNKFYKTDAVNTNSYRIFQDAVDCARSTFASSPYASLLPFPYGQVVYTQLLWDCLYAGESDDPLSFFSDVVLIFCSMMRGSQYEGSSIDPSCFFMPAYKSLVGPFGLELSQRACYVPPGLDSQMSEGKTLDSSSSLDSNIVGASFLSSYKLGPQESVDTYRYYVSVLSNPQANPISDDGGFDDP